MGHERCIQRVECFFLGRGLFFVPLLLWPCSLAAVAVTSDAASAHETDADSDAGPTRDARGEASADTTVDGDAGADAGSGGEVGDASDGHDVPTTETGGDGTDGPTAFASVAGVLSEHCAVCHDAQKHGLPTYGELDLTAAAAYDALVGKPTEACGGTLVVPGDAEKSYLVRKLTDAQPCFGLHMPRGFEILVPPPLDGPTMTLVRRWINDGAHR